MDNWDFPGGAGSGEIACVLQPEEQHQTQKLEQSVQASGVTALPKGKPLETVYSPQ